MLDKVQKRIIISDDEYKHLKKIGLVEGRKPNIFLSKNVIIPLNDDSLKSEYIRNKGFDDTYYKNLIVEYIIKWNEASRKQIENLLWDKLSDVLDENSKSHKIKNLLQSLKKDDKIALTAGRKWILKA